MATKKTTKSDKTKKSTKAETAPPVEQGDAGAATPATKTKAGKAKAPRARKTSALDAALRALEDAGQPMTCPEMIEAMTAKKYWTSPKGLTPAATLYSAVLREIKAKGKAARFVKAERGKFGLAKK